MRQTVFIPKTPLEDMRCECLSDSVTTPVMASKLHLELALTPDGWRRDVVVGIDHGIIASVEEPGHGPAERVSGVVLPGLPNLHSHAFQRAMAGLTERRGSEADYLLDLARGDVPLRRAAVGPDDLEAIAAFAYMEMLEAGFTAGGRVPLSASPARRPALRQRRPRCRSASWPRPTRPASA